jgi:hypothetical protein
MIIQVSNTLMPVELIIYVQIVIHALESMHDRWVIAGQNPDKLRQNRLWHCYDSAVWFTVHALVSAITGNVFYLVSGLVIRLWALQVFLNWMRGLPLVYLGAKGIDAWMNFRFGKRATLVLKTLLLTAVVIANHFN